MAEHKKNITRAQSNAPADPSSRKIARIYAQALFDLMDTAESAEQTAEQLEQLQDIFADSKLAELLSAIPSGGTQQAELLRRVFHARVPEKIESLLLVLASRGRIGIFSRVVEQFRCMTDTFGGRIPVEITTAIEPDDETIGEMTETFQRLFGNNILLRIRVDEKIIAGMIVRVADRVFDTSVARDLKRLKEQLTAGSINQEVGI